MPSSYANSVIQTSHALSRASPSGVPGRGLPSPSRETTWRTRSAVNRPSPRAARYPSALRTGGDLPGLLPAAFNSRIRADSRWKSCNCSYEPTGLLTWWTLRPFPGPPYSDGDVLGLSGDCDLDTLDQVANDLLPVRRAG